MSVWVTEPVFAWSQRHLLANISVQNVFRDMDRLYLVDLRCLTAIVLGSVKMHHWTHLKHDNIWFRSMETKVAKNLSVKILFVLCL